MTGETGLRWHMTQHSPTVRSVLREQLAERKLSQAQLADALAVSLLSAHQLCNGRRSVTADMALRLGKAFKTDPGYWLELQLREDLMKAASHWLTSAALERVKVLSDDY